MATRRTRSAPATLAFDARFARDRDNPNRGETVQLPRAWSAPPPKPPPDRAQIQQHMLAERAAQRRGQLVLFKAAPKRIRWRR